MPMPVSTARQCLTPDAAQALDDAVAVARCRSHAQTTSLHAVSALVSPPSSSSLLRDACTRARNSAYSVRIQFKALELCLGISLDRLPSSSHRSDEPPVSNSLMAAIKRSQANQRRQPESFHMYQQQQQSSSVTMVKVELQNLVLSILDDPVVSRVFSESGFRSCDIKLAILRPIHHQLLRYSRYRRPPVFLCNLTDDPGPGPRNFSFPFMGFSGFSNGDENCKRIGEVLARNKGRNPLLVGICANDALQNFCDVVEKRKGGYVYPVEIYGLNVIRIDIDVAKFMNGNCDDGSVKQRFGEIGQVVERCVGPGVVISYGDLKELIGDEEGASAYASASCVVGELMRLLDLHGGKVWLIGSAATYETYLRFLNIFPSVEKDWDLQLIPITSLTPAMGGDSYPRSSLMESFVPFGGLFSTPDLKSPMGLPYPCLSRCHHCNEKCEQEVSAIGKGGFTASVAEQYQSRLPFWLQMTELSTSSVPDVGGHITNDDFSLSAKVEGLHRKWDNICKRLHHAGKLTKGNIYQVVSQVPSIVGSQVGDDKKENADNHSCNETNASSNASGSRKVTSCMSMGRQTISRSQSTIPLRGVVSQDLDWNSLTKTREETTESGDLERCGVRSPPLSLSSSNGRASPPSATSVTTDLGLGLYAQSSSCSCPGFDQRDFKMLYRELIAKNRWQEKAVSSISQTIARCRTRNVNKCFGGSLRGDIWFSFLGPDFFSKKRIALSLAEILYGSKANIICVDLSSQDGVIGYDVKFRGKTVVDYIAGELSKKPFSVVFIENIDEADLTVQNSLSQAARIGKFSDSHGREVGISNRIFVTTSRFAKCGKILCCEKETDNYSEESIIRVKGWPIQIVMKGISNPVIVNKRKSIGIGEIIEERTNMEMVKRPHKSSNMHLDLNLPAEETEVHNTDHGSSGSDSISENKTWLEDFVELVDEMVLFKPFDFDKLAEKITKEISECFHGIVGSDCLLEIDSKVMEQVLAASCLFENNEVKDWVESVLSNGFIEAQKRYNLTTGCVVKLVACEGLFLEGEVPRVHLPSKILVN